MNAPLFHLGFALLTAGTVAWSQNYWGAGAAGSGPAGGAGGWGGGPTVARVNVAPLGGAGGLAAGGAGGAWMGNVGQAAGGLHGVTRPTFMSEPNAVAARFFGSAGVGGLPPTVGTAGGGAATAGVYLGQSRRAISPSLAVAPRRRAGPGPDAFTPLPAGYPALAATRSLPRR